jgi:hypothetical protein
VNIRCDALEDATVVRKDFAKTNLETEKSQTRIRIPFLNKKTNKTIKPQKHFSTTNFYRTQNSRIVTEKNQ